MKVAILGTAPSSIKLAPVDDPEWTIWGCSRGNTKRVKRVDEWFEIHSLERVFNDPAHPDYAEWLKTLPRVWFQHVEDSHPNSKAYPLKAMLDEFGAHFFSCSFAFMFAAALTDRPDLFDRTEAITDIGLWGIDLAANSEYQHQRPHAHHWMDLAKRKGIEVRLPVESDLSRPPPVYGYRETSHMGRKVALREQEILRKLEKVMAEKSAAKIAEAQLQGALDNLKYFERTWVDGY